MAGAKCKSRCCRRHSKSHPTSRKNVQQAAFLGVKKAYLPGEQLLLTYVINGKYEMNPGDSVALEKCGVNLPHELNPYRWPVSTTPVGNSYRTRIALPNPDRKLKTKEYQFVYISYESGKVIGQSHQFRIEDIIDLDDETDIEEDGSIELTLEAGKVSQQELFREPLTHPRPIRAASTTSSVGSVQSDSETSTYSEISTRVKPTSSTESIAKVAELIKQYEKINHIRNSVPRPLKLAANDNRVLAKSPQRSFAPTQPKLTEILQGLQRGSVPTRGIPMAALSPDELFMDSFLLPFINGVLEYLTKDGYSTIICRDDRNVFLENGSGQKTLDLRQNWTVNKENATKPQILYHHGYTVDELTQLYQQLEDELEELKHDSEVRELKYATQLHTSHAKEMRVVNRKIRKLERQMRTVLHSSRTTSKCTKHQDHMQQHQDSTLKDMELEVMNLQSINEVLVSHIKALEQELAEKTTEYGKLCQLFLDGQQLPAEPAATSAEGADYSSAVRKPVTNKPLVQKATSYAATSTADSEKTVSNDDRKPTTTSERELSNSPDQEEWLKLLKRLLKSRSATVLQETPNVNKSESSDSLAVAMRRLFNVCSSPSLASTCTSHHSLSSSDSVLEAIRSMFGDDSPASSLPVGSCPVTPCNSADNVGKKQKVKANILDHSSSMKNVLRWLFAASSEDLKKALPRASNESISSLGEAMKRMFNEEGVEEKLKEGLTTSNESLSEAMHRLFQTISQQSLNNQQLKNSKSSTSSFESVLWALTDSTPEEYKNVDIREYNIQRQKNHREGTPTTCGCSQGVKCERKNPGFSTVIRSSSPDDNVNISFPNRAALSRSPIAQRTTSHNQPKEHSFFDMATAEEMKSNMLSESLYTGSRGRSKSKKAKYFRSARLAKKLCPYCHQSVTRLRQHLQSAHRRCL